MQAILWKFENLKNLTKPILLQYHDKSIAQVKPTDIKAQDENLVKRISFFLSTYQRKVKHTLLAAVFALPSLNTFAFAQAKYRHI